MIKKVTWDELENIAFNNHYLPYEFFIEVNMLETIGLLFKGKTVYKVGNEFYTEMWGGVAMLVITLESAFYIAMLIFSIVGMVYGVLELFPALKNCKFLKSFFE